MKTRVFVDTSVLFASIYSEHGHARDLVNASVQRKFTLIISEDVLDELERNLKRKYPKYLPVLRHMLSLMTWLPGIEPTRDDVRAAMTYVVAKDAPIVAAAICSKVDYLATYDRKHLLDRPEVAARSGLRIVTPDVIMTTLDENQ